MSIRFAFSPILRWAAVVVAITLASLAAGCRSDTATPTSAVPAPIEVVDAGGATLTFDEPPRRIVSHSPGVTEILFAIGAGDLVVAADEFSDYPAEAAALPKVAYSDPDPERVLSFDPDLVILATQQRESVEHFRDLGLRVFFDAEPTTVAGVLENIALLGRLTGHETEAAALVEELRGRIDAVQSRLVGIDQGPRVFWELDDTLFTVGTDTFIGDMLRILKAQNVAEGAATSFPQLTAEAIVERDPQVILLADAAFGTTVESVAERPGWSNVSAVREGRVLAVNTDTTSRPGPRVVDAIEDVARLLYPEIFGTSDR